MADRVVSSGSDQDSRKNSPMAGTGVRKETPMYAFDHIRSYYWEFGPFQTYWRYVLMC